MNRREMLTGILGAAASAAAGTPAPADPPRRRFFRLSPEDRRKAAAANLLALQCAHDFGGLLGGKCSRCGRTAQELTFADHPELLADAQAYGRGEQLDGSDQRHWTWTTREIEQTKFYFQHLSEEQMRRFIELLNGKKLKLDFPGHFYRLPYFIRTDPKP